MKRHSLFMYLAALLTMLGSALPLNAQQKQDALYIFRNDGGFDAFFYADIERITYSNVDTFGVAHDDMVVQEIYALDTLFRIPLTAIDSVAFITPETVYKADVIRPDQLMTDYIVESDSSSWFRLAANTPAAVIPKVGDKLLMEDPVKCFPRGFSGVVTKVDQSTSGYTVVTDALGLEELFDRYVAKASTGAPNPEGPSSARRKGIGDFGRVDPIDASYQTSEAIELPTFTYPFTPAFNQEYNLVEAFNENLTVDLVGTISGTTSYTPTIKYFQTFLYWDVSEGLKTGMHLIVGNKSVSKITLSGALNAKLQIPFTIAKDAVKSTAKTLLKNSGKKVSQLLGKYDVDWGFGFFIGGSGTISADIFKEEYSTSAFNISLLKDNIDMFGTTTPITSDDIMYRKSYVAERDSFGANGWGAELALSMGFYASAEAKLPFIRGDKVELSAGVEAGVKLSSPSPIGISDVATIPMLETGKLYAILNREAETDLAIYGAFEAKASLGHTSFSLPADITLAKVAKWNFVPGVTGIRWDVDKKVPWRGDLISWWEGELFWPMDIGYAIYDTSKDLPEPKQVVDYTRKWFYFRTPEKWSQTFNDLDPGRFYTAYPQIKLWGGSILTDQKVDFTLGPPVITPDRKYVEFDEFLNTDSVNVRTNIANTEFTTSAKWLRLYWYKEKGRLDFTCEKLPETGEDIRKANVIGIGYDKEGKEIARDTIKVTQLRPYIEPQNVYFESKADARMVTVKTTMSNLKYEFKSNNNPDNFCSFNQLNDTTLMVSVKENKGARRTAVIDITGKTQGGKTINSFVSVIQEGTGEEESGPGPEFEDITLPGSSVNLNYLEYELYFDVKDEGLSSSSLNYYSNNYANTEEYEPRQRCKTTYDGKYIYALLQNENAQIYLKIDNNAKKDPIVDGRVIVKNNETYVDMRLKDVPSSSGWDKNEISFRGSNPGNHYDNYSPDQSPLTGLSLKLSSYCRYFSAYLRHLVYDSNTGTTYDEYVELSTEDMDDLADFTIDFKLKRFFDNRANDYDSDDDITLAEFPNASVIKQVEEAGMPVYLGSNPPPLNGAYTMEPYTLVKAQGPLEATDLILLYEDLNSTNPNYMHVKFTPTKDKAIIYETAYEYDESSALGAIYKKTYGTAKFRIGYGKFAIQGDGNRFTLSQLTRNPGGSKLTMISGEIEGDYIKNLYFIGADKLEEDFGLSSYSASYTIYNDGDYISESFKWDEADWSTWLIFNYDQDNARLKTSASGITVPFSISDNE